MARPFPAKAPDSGLYADPLAEAVILDQGRAIDRFLAEVERRAYRIALLAVGDRDEALDIVQDAMLRLVRGYADRPAADWRPLFYRILSNRITDQQRRQSVRRRTLAILGKDNGDDDEAPDPWAALPGPDHARPDQRVQAADALDALEGALRTLPPRQREAFLLRNLEGLDVAETAAAMECSEGSVKTHYFRAIHALRAALGDHWP